MKTGHIPDIVHIPDIGNWAVIDPHSLLTLVLIMDTNSSISAYLYPENYWQLDYSTDVEDVMENNSPTVHGDEPRLDISGDGRGYLKYKARVSSATLR